MSATGKIRWHAGLDPFRHRCACGCGAQAILTQFPNGPEAMPRFIGRHLVNDMIAAHRAAKAKETST